MLKLKKVAVTGGLSSGKSTVCRFFKELGACVVSADEIVHRLLSPDTNLGQEVIKLFGAEIITDNNINRKVIADKVFKDPKLLKKLEMLMHPAVRIEMEKNYQEAKDKKACSLFVAEIPLLFEANYDSFYDETICVIADEAISKERFRKATGCSDSEYQLRMNNQFSLKQKAEKADFVLVNNGDLSALKNQVIKVYQHLTKP